LLALVAGWTVPQARAGEPQAAPGQATAPIQAAGPLLGPIQGDQLVTVDVIDVGQGDAILLRSWTGKVVLIDTGPNQAWKALKGFLKKAGIKQIDALILTHPHADHIGNAARVIKAFKPRLVYDPGYPHTSAMYRNLLKLIQEKGVTYKRARPGMRLVMAEGVELTLLSPPDPLIHSDRSDLNANSIVTRLSYGAVRALFAADSEEDTERFLLANQAAVLPAAIYKVAHHGSRHSSTDAYLDRVRPEVALIPCGAGNTYGHPHRQALERLKKRGAAVYTTMNHGTLTIRIDGKHFSAQPEKSAPAL
jgi:competence protein ComEC